MVQTRLTTRSQTNLHFQLYDEQSQSYFYRDRTTGEFARNPPGVAEKPCEELWFTHYDFEMAEHYWENLESGQIAYFRPSKGVFLSESPLREFRRHIEQDPQTSYSKRHSSVKSMRSTQTTKSIKAKSTKRLSVVGDQDLDSENAFSESNPEQYDAGALLNSQSTNKKSVEMRRLSTRDGVETPEFPVLKEEEVRMETTMATENPLFGH